MSLVDGYSYLDTQLIRALTAAACEGPTTEQTAAAPEALVRFCRTGPRQVRDLYPWGQRWRYRPRMVRALVRDLVEREQLAASDPVGLADWSWVWHPDTATGPGAPPPLDPAELVAAPEEAEAVEEPEGEDEEEAPAPVEEEDDGLTYDQRRSARPRQVRAVTIHPTRPSKRSLALLPEESQPPSGERPRTRAECVDGPRPCGFVSCRHHLYLDVDPRSGGLKINFPDLSVEQMSESCSLDVADRGGATLEATGAMLNLSRERIRQLEVNALKHFARAADRAGIEMADLLDLQGKSTRTSGGYDGCEGGILALLQNGERDLSDLAGRLDYPRGTVTNQLTALIKAGLIERVGRGRYRLVGREAAE